MTDLENRKSWRLINADLIAVGKRLRPKMIKLGYSLHSEWEFFLLLWNAQDVAQQMVSRTIRHCASTVWVGLQAERWPVEMPEDQRTPLTYTHAAPLSVPDLPGLDRALLPRDLSESWHAWNCMRGVIKWVKAKFDMSRRNKLGMWGEAQRCKSCVFFVATRACPFELPWLGRILEWGIKLFHCSPPSGAGEGYRKSRLLRMASQFLLHFGFPSPALLMINTSFSAGLSEFQVACCSIQLQPYPSPLRSLV